MHNLKELLIALDQVLNVIVCILTFGTAWSDETLSAHCWRSYRDGKLWGRIFMPPIDAVFGLWQKPDPAYVDENNVPIKGHCRRAFLKERERAYLPPEYRKG